MEKKTILITGASKGIGLATSHHLAREGFHVVGIARHHPEGKFPGTFFPCDLSSAAETEGVLTEIAQLHAIDGIVNNVGIALPQPLGSIDLESLEAVYDLNVRTAIQVVQSFVHQMKEKKWGRIINISSRAIFGIAGRTSYAAAKCALIGCTRTWALELAPFRITVNAIAPGPIDTELFRTSRPVGSPEEKEVLASIPLGRVGKPEEIAASIAFLLSEGAAFITGHTLCVDGGASTV
ncbi:MAG: SDR family oxidoreductase [Chlamydiota bacterium]